MISIAEQHADPLVSSIQKIRQRILMLPSDYIDGIIDDVGTARNDLTKKEYELKCQFVEKYHDNEISHINIKGRGWVWQTHCRYGKKSRPRYKQKEDLIEYLYQLYAGLEDQQPIPEDFSFEAIFEAALQSKIITEGPKDRTVTDYQYQYKRFITPELARRDIRQIKPSELKEYILTIVTEQKPTKKALYKLKGVLNLVFDYACDPERNYVSVNPVPKKNKGYQKRCTPERNKPEDKAFQPEELAQIQKLLWARTDRLKYDVNGFAILFSSLTGVREGEIPAIKWTDVDFENRRIHVHAQQNDTSNSDAFEVKSSPYVTASSTGETCYYYNPCTKNERGISEDGRYIPMREDVEILLRRLKTKQETCGISSEWVFCKRSGDWILTKAYYSALYRLTKEELNLGRTNNHAFRIAYNSYVLIPAGLNVTERAKILGHSVETNLRHYTVSKSDKYLKEITDKLDNYDKDNFPEDDRNLQSSTKGKNSEDGTPVYPRIIEFKPKRKSPRTANS